MGRMSIGAITKSCRLMTASLAVAVGCGTPGGGVRDGAIDSGGDANARVDATTTDTARVDVPAADVNDPTDANDAMVTPTDVINADARVDAGCHLPVPAVDSLSGARDAC